MRPVLLVLAPAAAVLAAALLAAGPACAAEYREKIALSEPLGRTWTDELVHYDVKVPQARVAAATFALIDADGKPVPLQTEVLDGRADAVRKVRLWFKTTLPAAGEVSYVASWNDEGRKAPRAGRGVVVRRGDDRLIVLGGPFEVMIPAPAKPFEKPVEMRKAPAPILGVRPAGEQSWFGAWSFDGAGHVKELRAVVEASGPVWAQVRLRYAVEERGQSYEVALRVVRGEPWVDVSERYRLPAGTRLTAVLGNPRGRAAADRWPAEVLWMPWYGWREGRAEAASDLVRVPLDGGLRPESPFATLRPRWTEMRGAAQALVALAPGDATAALGAVMTFPAEWVRPYEQFPTARALEGREGVALEFPLAEGRRRWALLAGRAERFDSEAELQALIRRAADLPLDRVLNDFVLQWRRDPANPAPHIQATWPQVQALRADLEAGRDTPAAGLLRRALAGEPSGDRRAAERLAGRAEPGADGDAGAVAAAAEAILDRSLQDAPLHSPAFAATLAEALRAADLASAGRPAGGAAAALLGYVLSDPDFSPRTGGWDPGDPAYNRNIFISTIYAAAMMPDHPHARRWAGPALAAIREDLRQAVATASGAAECPAAAAATLAAVLPAMLAAQGAGLAEDPFRWPEARAALEFLRNVHSPPDPRLGRRCLAPFGGAEPWQDGVGATFGLAAAGLRQADPSLAAQCMAMYRNYYGDRGSGDLVRDAVIAAAEPAAKGPGPAAWASRAWPGFGAVLRSAAGTDREALAAFRCGSAAGQGSAAGAAPSRGRGTGEELAFHFFGAGMPLALDWYAGPRPRIDQENMHNRVTLGDGENMDAAGELVAMEASPAADLAVGQVRTDRLRQMPPYPRGGALETAYPRRTLASEARCRRYLMLVKHGGGPIGDYLVIRDEVVSTEPATFNLWVLARGVTQDGQMFRFDGQLAADAVAFFAAPGADRVRLDRWAWPREDQSSMIPEGFRIAADTWRTGELQQGLHVTAPPGQAFLVVLYPYRKGGAAPEFQALAGGKGVRLTLGGASEDVYLATDAPRDAGGQAVVRRGGQSNVILKAGAIAPLGKSAEQ